MSVITDMAVARMTVLFPSTAHFCSTAPKLSVDSYINDTQNRNYLAASFTSSSEWNADKMRLWTGKFHRKEDRPATGTSFSSSFTHGSRGSRLFRVMAEAGNSVEASDSSIVEKKREYFLPSTLEESIDQARTATRQAIRDGVKRIQLEVLLPLIGATDLDDWPGGIQQQFKAAGPVITSLLTGLVDGESYKGDAGYRKYIIDDSDAVGGWESDKLALVLFPTSETLLEVESLSKNEDRPLLIVNCQWQSGQVISDFGFGSQKRAREAFVNSFEMVYFLKSMRILGEDVCLLKRYPGDWQVFVVDGAGVALESVAVVPQRPSYKELEAILRSRKGSKADQGWFARLFSELDFNRKSLTEDQKS